MWKRSAVALMPVLATLLALTVGGCSKGDGNKDQAENREEKKDKDKTAAKKVHTHDQWWCDEHGIPEHLCSMCNEKVAAECKKKGDWCKKHDRALSQCFICRPERKEYYAKMYRQRYGKEPPPIGEK